MIPTLRRITLLLAPLLALLVVLVAIQSTSAREVPELAAPVSGEGVRANDGVADLTALDVRADPTPAAADRTSVEVGLAAAGTAWSGRVEDAVSGAPIAGATVRVQRGDATAETATGEAGEFTLRVAPDPELTLLVAHDAYVDLREARPDLLDARVLRLQPSGVLRGVLRGPGAAAGDAEVGLWPSVGRGFDGEPLARATPDSKLAFRFTDLAPGLYGVGVVGGRGPLAFQDGVLVGPPAEAFVTLEVPAGLGLAGRVVEGEARHPIEGALVSVRCEIQGIDSDVERLSRRDVETDADGSFAVDGLTEGSLELEARTPWGARRELRDNVSSLGATDEMLIVFPTPGRIAGVVRTSTGAPATAIVGVLTDGDRGLRRSLLEEVREGGLEVLAGTAHAWTGAGGRFVLDRVPSDERLYLFALPDPGSAETEGPASMRLPRLEPGQSLEDVELSLVAHASLAGRVVDEHGAPIAGVHVELVRDLVSESQTVDEVDTDEHGAFVLHGAVRENGSVVASHDDYDRERVRLDGHDLDQPLELRLSASPTARGRVVDEAGGAVAGVVVQFREQTEDRRRRRNSRSDRTDEFGRFGVERIDPGTYQVELRDAEWSLADEELSVEIPLARELVLVATRGAVELPASAGGEVVDAATGGVVPRLEIDGARGGVVRIQGRRFDLEGMRPGETSLELEAPGYETIRTEPQAYTPGSHVELGTFELWRAGDLRVRVLDPDGELVARAAVALHPLSLADGGVGTTRSVLPIEEGRGGRGRGRDRGWPYARGDVPLRTFDLEVRREGFRVHRERIELAGWRTDVTVELRRED